MTPKVVIYLHLILQHAGVLAINLTFIGLTQMSMYRLSKTHSAHASLYSLEVECLNKYNVTTKKRVCCFIRYRLCRVGLKPILISTRAVLQSSLLNNAALLENCYMLLVRSACKRRAFNLEQSREVLIFFAISNCTAYSRSLSSFFPGGGLTGV